MSAFSHCCCYMGTGKFQSRGLRDLLSVGAVFQKGSSCKHGYGAGAYDKGMVNAHFLPCRIGETPLSVAIGVDA